MSDSDLIAEATAALERCIEAETENRKNYEDDVRFAMLGEQWDKQVQEWRRNHGKPCLTINRMPSFVRQVVNDARQNMPQISVKAVDSFADPNTADVLRGIIKNIEYSSNASAAYDHGIMSSVVGGFGYWRITTDYAHNDSFDMDLRIERIMNPLTVYGDPDSEAVDSSDWNVTFITSTLSRDAFKVKYKGADAIDFEAYQQTKDCWRDDKDTVRIGEYWTRTEVDREIVLLSSGDVVAEDVYEKHREYYDAMQIQVMQSRTSKGWQVKQQLLTGVEVLETVEWQGQYIPIIPCYGEEVIIDGKRIFKSLIRDAKDAQRMFNYWRSASSEAVACMPKPTWIGRVGQFITDGQKWKNAHKVAFPFIQYDDVQGAPPPQLVTADPPPAGSLQEALNASDDMKSVIGMYDAALGNRSNETSGIAINARKRESDVGTFHFVDNLNRAIRHTGVVLLDMIPHVYTGERVLRVIGQDGTTQNVKANTQASKEDVQQGIYNLSAGKYDVAIDVGASYTTRREETATQMMELIRANPQMFSVVGDLLVKSLDWTNADEIAERLKAMLPPQIQGENPQVTQLQGQLQEALGKAELEKQKLAIEQQKVEVSAYEAETDRMQAIQASMTPQDIQAVVIQTLRDIMTQGNPMPDQQQGMQPMPQQPTMDTGYYPPQQF